LRNTTIRLDELMPLIRERLEMGESVRFSPHGTSMLPMLRDGEDIVILSKPQGRLHLFDLPLYRRKDGTYVLHRVINFDSDRGYVMCGDNQFKNEHGVYDEDIIGVVTAFNRKGKPYTVHSLRYRFYVHLWYNTKTLRRSLKLGKLGVSKIFPKKKKPAKKDCDD